MEIDLHERPLAALAEHARISIAFKVASQFEITTHDRGEFRLTERMVDPPYVKDYDAINDPADWSERFDLSNWGLIVAEVNGLRVGGVIVAFDTPSLDMLAQRNDLAVVWDLRVAEACRRQGAGHALFAAAEQWAVKRSCRALIVETQNINVPACRFYERQGCRLANINRTAYREFPHEVQMIWRKEL